MGKNTVEIFRNWLRWGENTTRWVIMQLGVFGGLLSRYVKHCLHAFRAYMTESIQTEIIMLSIAYMPFAPTLHDRNHTKRNNHVKYWQVFDTYLVCYM